MLLHLPPCPLQSRSVEAAAGWMWGREGERLLLRRGRISRGFSCRSRSNPPIPSAPRSLEVLEGPWSCQPPGDPLVPPCHPAAPCFGVPELGWHHPAPLFPAAGWGGKPQKREFSPRYANPGLAPTVGGQERGVPSRPAADKSSLISGCPLAPLHPCLILLCHGAGPQERSRTGPWQHGATPQRTIWGLAGLAAAPGLGFWGAPGKPQLGGGSSHLGVRRNHPGGLVGDRLCPLEGALGRAVGCGVVCGSERRSLERLCSPPAPGHAAGTASGSSEGLGVSKCG